MIDNIRLACVRFAYVRQPETSMNYQQAYCKWSDKLVYKRPSHAHCAYEKTAHARIMPHLGSYVKSTS